MLHFDTGSSVIDPKLARYHAYFDSRETDVLTTATQSRQWTRALRIFLALVQASEYSLSAVLHNQ